MTTKKSKRDLLSTESSIEADVKETRNMPEDILGTIHSEEELRDCLEKANRPQQDVEEAIKKYRAARQAYEQSSAI